MKHNFSAGPSILPQSVMQQASEAVSDLNGSGLSILEISHRSPAFEQIMQEAQQLPKEILGLDDSWEVLYLTGGASSQFYMTAMNLLHGSEKASYIDTGAWSKKAIAEATALANIDIIASSGDKGYTYIPKDFVVPSDSKYLHFTSNNTIFGTQFHAFPKCDVPMVADMSSDIFSREIDVDQFGLIYCGAQKNLGPAGVTLVLLKKDFLGAIEAQIPTMLKYQTHISKGSMFNTPPVFPIYVSMLNMRWLQEQGGLAGISALNRAKAELIYSEIDTNEMFNGVVVQEDRSHMNATFTLANDSQNETFLQMCSAANIVGVKGHRSVGGFRASMYNGMKIDSVRVLVEVMSEFKRLHG